MRARKIGQFQLVLFGACLVACGDDSASDGSTTQATGDTGAEEEGGGADDADDADDPGPDGIGCGEPWEGWWDQNPENAAAAAATLVAPEAKPQRGRWRARQAIDAQPAPAPSPASTPRNEDDFRATLISEDAVLSTGRNLGVSWCLANIRPNPQGLGGVIDEEQEAINLERYLLFRQELERATRTWERHSRMNFVHLVGLDDRRKPSGGTCDTSLEHVWFRAQTDGCNTNYQGLTNAGGENEFDPLAGSPQNPGGFPRVLCIAWQFLQSAKTRIPYYAGHESDHVVGLEHEFIRWNQGQDVSSNCDDNDPFVPVSSNRTLTPPDPWSVMGYAECVGSENSKGVSPIDMLGAYYTFNWTERRVRDMAPQTGGRDQRLWAADNQPGIL